MCMSSMYASCATGQTSSTVLQLLYHWFNLYSTWYLAWSCFALVYSLNYYVEVMLYVYVA